MRRLVRGAILSVVIAAIAGTVMAQLATLAMRGPGWLGPIFETASNLRLQYLLLLVPATLRLALARNVKLAVLTGGLALLNIVHVSALALDPTPTPAQAATSDHRAVLLNAYYKSHAYADVLELIREKKPDVAVLVEVTPGLAEALQQLSEEYPYRQAYPRLDAGGLAVLSRRPLESVHRYPFGSWKRAVVVARTRIGERPITLVGMHPYSSRGPERSRLRALQLRAVARWVASQDEPVLVLGDLNITPWSPLFVDFLERSGLRDARRGFGVLPTYPAWFPLLWLPLDHCLVSADLLVGQFRVGPYAGSDHFPVVVDFSLARPGERLGWTN